MRIIELLEGNNFNERDHIKQIGDKGGQELDFDLVGDLIFFMNNDDEAYRRHLHPTISICIDRINANKSTKPSVFDNAVHKCYHMYVQKYPIRILDDSLDDALCNEICEKLHEEVCQHITDGKHNERKNNSKRPSNKKM
jgi:hypothetical protein